MALKSTLLSSSPMSSCTIAYTKKISLLRHILYTREYYNNNFFSQVNLICPLIQQWGNWVISSVNDKQQRRAFGPSKVKETAFMLIHQFLKHKSVFPMNTGHTQFSD